MQGTSDKALQLLAGDALDQESDHKVIHLSMVEPMRVISRSRPEGRVAIDKETSVQLAGDSAEAISFARVSSAYTSEGSADNLTPGRSPNARRFARMDRP